MEQNRMRGDNWALTNLTTVRLVLCLVVALSFVGCGQTAPSVAPPAAANQVNSYFGSPFTVAGSSVSTSVSKFDHSASQIGVTAFITTTNGQVPAEILNGAFATSPTGFLSITEKFATPGGGVISPQNPPLTGAWAVEIPGAGALANLLNKTVNGSTVHINAAAAAMAENTACPDFQSSAPFLYVTVPPAAGSNQADYGTVGITSQGSAVTFGAQPFLIKPAPLATLPVAATVTGGCSDVFYGPLVAYPLNSFGTPSNVELIAIGASGLLISSFTGNSGASRGAFGGGTSVIGIAAPSSPTNISAVVGAKYNGFIYAPQNAACQGAMTGPCVSANYDITTLASAFGDDAANSQACSNLQSSLAANNGQGTNSVAALPSANTLYGGEFRSTTGGATVNDPTVASGSENCDVAVDLGMEDSANNGLFPNATVFIGSGYPPWSTANPWNCFGTTNVCAVSFPAAAVVGQVQGQYVVFVAANAASSTPAALPDSQGNAVAHSVGIYLFQKSQ